MFQFIILSGAGVFIYLIPDLLTTGTELHRSLKGQFSKLTLTNKHHSQMRDWPEFIDDVATGLKAGLSLDIALLEAIPRAPKSIRKILISLGFKLQHGKSMASALGSFSEGSLDVVGKRFFTAMQLAQECGGREVIITLRLLSENIRRDLALLDELKAKQKGALNGARVAVLAPWMIILITSMQERVAAAYLSKSGLVVLLSILITSTISYLLMHRISRLEYGYS